MQPTSSSSGQRGYAENSSISNSDSDKNPLMSEFDRLTSIHQKYQQQFDEMKNIITTQRETIVRLTNESNAVVSNLILRQRHAHVSVIAVRDNESTNLVNKIINAAKVAFSLIAVVGAAALGVFLILETSS